MASGAAAAGRVRDTIDRRMNLVQKRLLWTFGGLLLVCLVVALGTGVDAGSKVAANGATGTCASTITEWHICTPISLKFFGISLGVLAASGAVGGFLGFLFGVPRLMQRVNRTEAAPGSEQTFTNLGAGKTSRSVAANSNLEEISDWLTKIIVGVALVQAQQIGAYGLKIVSFLATFGGTDDKLAKAYFACLIVTSFILCFLAVYLEARTRLTAMLSDMEHLLDNGLDADITSDANERPILTETEGPELDRNPEPANDNDRRLVQTPFDGLYTPEEFAAWGSAQARLKNLQAAARAVTEAVTRAPDNTDYLLRLADIRRLQGNLSLEIDALQELLRKTPDDNRKLLQRLVLLLLYRPPPDGFSLAATLCEELRSADLDRYPNFLLYYAAAQGQRARWLKENREKDPNFTKDFEDAKDKALAAATKIARRKAELPEAYTFLKDMLYPAPGSPDDDLSVFKDTDDFKTLIPE